MNALLLSPLVLASLFSSVTFAAEEQKSNSDSLSYLVTDFQCTGLADAKLIPWYFSSDQKTQEIALKSGNEKLCEQMFEMFKIKKSTWISVSEIEKLSLEINNSDEFKNVDIKLIPASIKGQVILSADFTRKSNYLFTVNNTIALYDAGKGLQNSFKFDILAREYSPIVKMNAGMGIDYLKVKDSLYTNVGSAGIRDARDITGLNQNSIFELTPYIGIKANLFNNINFEANYSYVYDNDGKSFSIDLPKQDLQFNLNYQDNIFYGLGNFSISTGARVYDETYNSAISPIDDLSKITLDELSRSIENRNQVATPNEYNETTINLDKKYNLYTSLRKKELYGYKINFNVGNDNSFIKYVFDNELYTSFKGSKTTNTRFMLRSNLGEVYAPLKGFYAKASYEHSHKNNVVLPTDRNRIKNPETYTNELTFGAKQTNNQWLSDVSLTYGTSSTYTNSGNGSISKLYIKNANANRTTDNQSQFIGLNYGVEMDSMNVNLGAKYFLNRMF